MEQLGKLVLLAGLVLVILGGALVLFARVPFLGKLPGNLQIRTAGFSCFLPLATSLVLSIIATIVLNLILRMINK